MDKYYYLVAQLPTLSFDKDTHFTTESFLDEAAKWVSKRDLKLLLQVSFTETSADNKGPRLWQSYRTFERTFRQELADWRKSMRSGQEFKPSSFPLSLVKEGNPLEVEKNLLAHRWKYLDELEAEHHFDIEVLILYYIRLQILEQLALYDKQKGLEIFQKISKVEI